MKIGRRETLRRGGANARGGFRRARGHLWERVGRGLVVIIPLLVTAIILRYLIAAVEALFAPAVSAALGVPAISDIPAAAVIVWIAVLGIAAALLYTLGALASGAKGSHRVNGALSAITGKIPVVGSIYGAARQATEAIAASRDQAFSRVIFLEWPRPGVHAMGLVTGQCSIPGDDRTMLVVYIATIPNPTSGMLAIIPEEDAIDSNLSVEDAMKIIFSGGIVMPDALSADAATLNLPQESLWRWSKRARQAAKDVDDGQAAG